MVEARTFFNISDAAVACALGGKFLRHIENNGRIHFLIEVPAEFDLSDPSLTVPVPALKSWTTVLAVKVRAFHQRQRDEGVTR